LRPLTVCPFPITRLGVSFSLTRKASLKWIASQGITLSNYKAITHPSQPNYVAAVGGSQHWVWEDWSFRIGSSVKTIADLLEDGGVSWSVYQEDMPYSGFEGNWVNQENGRNMYVRKHK
jgi:acid phosphatase